MQELQAVVFWILRLCSCSRTAVQDAIQDAVQKEMFLGENPARQIGQKKTLQTLLIRLISEHSWVTALCVVVALDASNSRSSSEKKAK